MQQRVRGTKTWLERITLSPNPQVKRAKELEGFTKRAPLSLNNGEPLDMNTRKLMEAFFGYNLENVQFHHGHQAETTSRSLGARAFTLGSHIFGPQRGLNSSTREGRGLLVHELTHVIQQTRPNQIPQGNLATPEDLTPVVGNQRTGSSRALSTRQYPDTEMTLKSPLKSSPPTTKLQLREAQAQASEQLVTGGSGQTAKSRPQINLEEVANKVYRLMQHDLILERERATRVGG